MGILKRLVENEKINPKSLRLVYFDNMILLIQIPNEVQEKSKNNYVKIMLIKEIRGRIKKCNLLQ